MPAITIENLPTSIYEQLMQAATLHQRNLTQEIVRRLEQSFLTSPSASTPPRHLEAIIADARASRTLHPALAAITGILPEHLEVRDDYYQHLLRKHQ